jgi:transposase-like protein
MKEGTTKEPSESTIVCYEALEGWARGKIQGWMQDLLEEEVTSFLGRGKSERRNPATLDRPEGYRNGYGKPRGFGMMSGTITLRRPRIRGLEERFESRVIPLFRRQTSEIKEMLPELYLHGLALGDFELALRGLLGDASPLSVSSLLRLRAKWRLEYEAWKRSDLSDLEVVYWWADGLYVKAGIEDRKTALLVIVGALKEGGKLVLGCESGERESKESWLKVLRDLKSRGLKFPALTIADGHLGIWAALGEIHPSGDEQRCWNHKIVNVLDALPKKEHPEAVELLKAMAYAPTRKECERKRTEFMLRYKKTDPKAVETLNRDWERMTTFYSYPKEHWIHLRTTNIVESPFSAIRLRTDAARRYKKAENAKAMIWKLLMVAQKTWRKLNAPEKLPEVYAGRRCVDGNFTKNEEPKAAA